MTPNNKHVEIAGKRYKLVVLDFETYYDSEYTLSGKMNMSEYVRDERFKAHGVAIKHGDSPTLWYTGDNIARALAEIDWANTALLAHNTAFDGFICSEIYKHKPAFYLDTLSMARAVHGHHTRHDLDTLAKLHKRAGKVKRAALANTKGKPQLTAEELSALGAYGVDDVDDTTAIFWDLYEHFPDDELRLVDITLRMFCDAVLRVDTARATEELHREIGAKAAALLKTGCSVEELMSNVKFADRLRALGVEPPIKFSLTNGNATYAFAKGDLDFQKLLLHPEQEVVDLVEARLKVKSTIGETRAARLIEAGKDGQALPVLLNYSGAHTHRWSGGNKMNLQNLNRGGELRRSIVAPRGHVIVVADSSQIEARVLAWVARQKDIVEAFANKQDVYKRMASSIYNKHIDHVTKDERFIGKVCVLGLGYGMGPARLQHTLASGTMGPAMGLTSTDCARIVNIYRSVNHKITEYWKSADRIITDMYIGSSGRLGPIEWGKRFVCLPNGLFLQYYGLKGEFHEYPFPSLRNAEYMNRNGFTRIYGGLLTENIVQALARCVIAEQMLQIADEFRVVTMTHDEIVAIAPKRKADACLERMLKIMRTPPAWARTLPLDAEGGWDVNYSK